MSIRQVSFCFFMIIFLFFTACASLNRSSMTVSATGDIMMHGRIQKYALSEKNGYHSLFEPTARIFLNDDLTIGNLETPVCDSLPVSDYPQFNVSSKLLDAIKDSGIEAVSLANNHALDKGAKGIISTVSELKKRNLFFAGTGESQEESARPVIINKNGITLAFLSATDSTNIDPNRIRRQNAYVNVVSYNNKAMSDYCEVIKKIKKDYDAVILSYHSGNEYETAVDPKKEKAMKMFADSGADVILGHHPHVLQRIEYYNTADKRKTLIVYSLGNFISAQASYVPELNKKNIQFYNSLVARTAESVILQFDIIKKNSKISISNAWIIPVFNICFWVNKEKKYLVGFKTLLMSDIFDENSIYSKDMIADLNNLRKISEYRMTKIKELINIPVLPLP